MLSRLAFSAMGAMLWLGFQHAVSALTQCSKLPFGISLFHFSFEHGGDNAPFFVVWSGVFMRVLAAIGLAQVVFCKDFKW